jgi:hypothetical protein
MSDNFGNGVSVPQKLPLRFSISLLTSHNIALEYEFDPAHLHWQLQIIVSYDHWTSGLKNNAR